MEGGILKYNSEGGIPVSLRFKLVFIFLNSCLSWKHSSIHKPWDIYFRLVLWKVDLFQGKLLTFIVTF